MIGRHQKSSQLLSSSFTSYSSTASTPTVSPSSLNASMMLRRHSTNPIQSSSPTRQQFISDTYDENSTLNNTLNGFTNLTNTTNNAPSINPTSIENSQLMTKLMKTTCPTYYDIPRNSRKRILRFLCDNGWIGVSS